MGFASIPQLLTNVIFPVLHRKAAKGFDRRNKVFINRQIGTNPNVMMMTIGTLAADATSPRKAVPFPHGVQPNVICVKNAILAHIGAPAA
jgi:hypothetical protein